MERRVEGIGSHFTYIFLAEVREAWARSLFGQGFSAS